MKAEPGRVDAGIDHVAGGNKPETVCALHHKPCPRRQQCAAGANLRDENGIARYPRSLRMIDQPGEARRLGRLGKQRRRRPQCGHPSGEDRSPHYSGG